MGSGFNGLRVWQTKSVHWAIVTVLPVFCRIIVSRLWFHGNFPQDPVLHGSAKRTCLRSRCPWQGEDRSKKNAPRRFDSRSLIDDTCDATWSGQTQVAATVSWKQQKTCQLAGSATWDICVRKFFFFSRLVLISILLWILIYFRKQKVVLRNSSYEDFLQLKTWIKGSSEFKVQDYDFLISLFLMFWSFQRDATYH